MYESREEFQQKVGNSVVLFDNRPTLIMEASGKNGQVKLEHRFLTESEGRIDVASDPLWDFKSIGSRLGYTNVDIPSGLGHSYKEASYLTRVAIRVVQSCQGLCSKNVKATPLLGSKKLGLAKVNLTWGHIHNTKYLTDTICRKYPTLFEVAADFSKDDQLQSKAFHHNFAVRRTDVGPFYLEYKGKDIGYSEDFYNWKIGKDFRHLDETLEYINLKVA